MLKVEDAWTAEYYTSGGRLGVLLNVECFYPGSTRHRVLEQDTRL